MTRGQSEYYPMSVIKFDCSFCHEPHEVYFMCEECFKTLEIIKICNGKGNEQFYGKQLKCIENALKLNKRSWWRKLLKI